MDNENIYEHRLRVRSGAYPTRGTQQVPRTNNPGPSRSDLYNISSNHNIFPRKERDYDHAFIDRQRSADIGADPRQPVSMNSAKGLNYTPFESEPVRPLKENYHDGMFERQKSRAIVRGDVKMDPLTKLSQTFNNFASANEFITTNEPTPVVPASVITPPEFPFVRPEEQPSNDPVLPPPESRPPIDDESREQPLSEPDYRVTLEKNILGNQRMASYSYPHVFRDRPFMQLPQMNLIVNPKPLYLHVESGERNRARFPNPAQYVFPLVTSSNDVDTPGERYRNVCEVSLVSATVPNLASVLNQPYLILQIDEIGGHYDAAGPACNKAFAKLYFDNPGGAFLRVDKGIGDPAVRVFYPKPLASLSRLSISIRNPDGTLFNFGTDTSPPQAANPLLQNSFTFQIITKITDVNEAIGHRNP
jgi:hypothetical protein